MGKSVQSSEGELKLTLASWRLSRPPAVGLTRSSADSNQTISTITPAEYNTPQHNAHSENLAQNCQETGFTLNVQWYYA